MGNAYDIYHRYKWLLRLRPQFIADLLKRALKADKREVVDTPYGKFYLDPITSFGKIILENQVYEPKTVEVLKSHLKKSDTFIDVGANEGYFTVIASKLVGENGLVIAVEPQKRLIPILQKNLELNNLNNVYIENIALAADSAGKLSIFLHTSITTGGSSITEKYYFARKQKTDKLSMYDLFQKHNINYADLVKIDVEGFEPEVIRGAHLLLKDKRIRKLLVDYHESILHNRGLSSGKLHNFILQHNYRMMGDVFEPNGYTAYVSD